MAVKLGWKAGPEQFGPNELLDFVVVAEDSGFEFVDVSDHFHPWDESGQACFVWTWLGAAAARTRSIVLGPGVTCPILRYEPAVIAQAAATMEVMAPGRTYLAVGTGEALNELSVTGLWPPYGERQRMLAEAIRLIRELWTGEKVSFSGEYFETRKAKLYTLPESPPPLYIAAGAPASARFAGKHSDGLFTVGGQPSDVYRRILEAFEDGARQQEGEPAEMARIIEVAVEYTDDIEAAVKNRKQYWAGAFVPALFKYGINEPRESALQGSVVGSDTVQRAVCISADPEEHVKAVKRYADLGFTHIVFHSADPDQAGFLKRYGSEVLPLLRERL